MVPARYCVQSHTASAICAESIRTMPGNETPLLQYVHRLSKYYLFYTYQQVVQDAKCDYKIRRNSSDIGSLANRPALFPNPKFVIFFHKKRHKLYPWGAEGANPFQSVRDPPPEYIELRASVREKRGRWTAATKYHTARRKDNAYSMGSAERSSVLRPYRSPWAERAHGPQHLSPSR